MRLASSHTAPSSVLPNFCPVEVVSSGKVIPSLRSPSNAPDQFLAGENISPLIAAAHLDSAVVVLEQVEKVISLHQHVAEFGVGDTLIALFEPGAHGIALDHLVDRKMLADVAQKIEQVERTEASRHCSA